MRGKQVMFSSVKESERWQPGFLDFVRQTTSDCARNDNFVKRAEILDAAVKETPRLK